MAPRNQFPSRGSLDSATDAFAVTPGTGDLRDIPRALWVGTGGDLAVTLASGDVILKAVPDGTLLPIKPSRVLSSGTTAADIVALL